MSAQGPEKQAAVEVVNAVNALNRALEEARRQGLAVEIARVEPPETESERYVAHVTKITVLASHHPIED